MALTFTKASKKAARLRLALVGPAGSGKTFSALAIATAMGERVAVMDTEHGSASKYAGEFEFDTLEPESFNPQVYIDVIRAAEEAGYDVLVIDSLSHAWSGKDGALEMVDRAAKRNSGNSFAGWRDVTPLHNQMVEAMLASRLHLIVTMRTKTEYVVEEDSRGKKVPRKIGLQPVQRDGLEYEFDVVGDMDLDHNLLVTKTRCRALADAVVQKPGAGLAATLTAWLGEGEPMAAAAQIAELRRLAAARSPRAAAAMEEKIAHHVTAAQAAEWIAALRSEADEVNEAFDRVKDRNIAALKRDMEGHS